MQHQQQQTPNTMKIAVSDQIRKLLLDHVNQANHDGGGFPEGVAADGIDTETEARLDRNMSDVADLNYKLGQVTAMLELMQDKESKTWGTLAKKEDIERDRARCGSISFCCGCSSSSSSSLGMVLPDVDIVDPLLFAGWYI